MTEISRGLTHRWPAATLIVTALVAAWAAIAAVGCTDRGASSTAVDTSTERGGPEQTVTVVITEKGFEPASVSLTRGSPARLTFVRRTDQTCATDVVVPGLKERRALPLNEPVTIEFTPRDMGEIAFACGMDMLKGTITVQ